MEDIPMKAFLAAHSGKLVGAAVSGAILLLLVPCIGAFAASFDLPPELDKIMEIVMPIVNLAERISKFFRMLLFLTN